MDPSCKLSYPLTTHDSDEGGNLPQDKDDDGWYLLPCCNQTLPLPMTATPFCIYFASTLLLSSVSAVLLLGTDFPIKMQAWTKFYIHYLVPLWRAESLLSPVEPMGQADKISWADCGRQSISRSIPSSPISPRWNLYVAYKTFHVWGDGGGRIGLKS